MVAALPRASAVAPSLRPVRRPARTASCSSSAPRPPGRRAGGEMEGTFDPARRGAHRHHGERRSRGDPPPASLGGRLLGEAEAKLIFHHSKLRALDRASLLFGPGGEGHGVCRRDLTSSRNTRASARLGPHISLHDVVHMASWTRTGVNR